MSFDDATARRLLRRCGVALPPSSLPAIHRPVDLAVAPSSAAARAPERRPARQLSVSAA